MLELIARGLSNAEIAGRFFLREGIAKGHVSRILTKLELRDRAGVLAEWVGTAAAFGVFAVASFAVIPPFLRAFTVRTQAEVEARS